jgi:O-methyltransferase involved in polyketide biosynthesis
MAPVLNAGKPTLFLSEAVIIYFEEPQVKQALVQIAKQFPGAWFATDICGPKLTAPKVREKYKKLFGIKSWFKWACEDPKSIERWHPGIELLASQTFADASPDIVAKMPIVWRTLTRFAPFIVRHLTKDYRIAHYRLGAR